MKCIICGETDFSKLPLINEVSRYDKKSYPLFKCKFCGLIRPEPLPYSDEDKLDIYDESENIKFYNTKTNKIEENTKEYDYYFKHFIPYVNFIRKYKIKGKALDVGCGVGHLMKLIKKEGLDVEGTEITKKISMALRGKFKVYIESLEELSVKKKTWNLITANHVLEHVEDPNRFIIDLRNILRKNGHVIISVPYIYGLIPQILRTRWYGLGYGQHLNFFSIKSIVKLLKDNNFEIVEIKKLSVDYAHPRFPKIINILANLIMSMIVKLNMGDNLFVVARKRE